MRILFINTLDTAGGAAVITQRLMKGLKHRYSTNNFLLVKTKQGNDEHSSQILHNKIHVASEKIIDRITRPAGLLYQFFPFSSGSILRRAASFRPDVINIHNTHGAYFATPLLKYLSRVAPIAWTLHDMWSFTGNASHTFGNMSWKYLENDASLKKIPPAIGINSGRWLLKQKKKIYAASDLTIITPSTWLQNLATQSPLFEEKQIIQIYNGIDTNIFKPADKAVAKHQLGLPAAKTIMFSSHFLNKNNPWKGGRDLLEILGRMNQLTQTKINLLILGDSAPAELAQFSNFTVASPGYVKDEALLVKCLNATDVFIYPTRADTLPNVLIEAIACGTPCVTFDIGGNAEIIKHDVNGLIIEPFDFDQFARQTVDVLDEEDRLADYASNAVNIAREVFPIEKMIDRYYTAFGNIIKNRKMPHA